jgi:hypothetical protein
LTLRLDKLRSKNNFAKLNRPVLSNREWPKRKLVTRLNSLKWLRCNASKRSCSLTSNNSKKPRDFARVRRQKCSDSRKLKNFVNNKK